MQQFVVPQFIDVEDKIFGPLAVRQFVILMAGGMLTFLEYKLADFTLFVFEALFTLGLTAIFAFAKVNGMPFHYFLLNLIVTVRRPRVRVWQKSVDRAELKTSAVEPVVVAQAAPASHKPPLTRSRLQELTLVVDTGGAYVPEDELLSKSKSEG